MLTVNWTTGNYRLESVHGQQITSGTTPEPTTPTTCSAPHLFIHMNRQKDRTKGRWEAAGVQYTAAVVGLGEIRRKNNALEVKVALIHCAALVHEAEQEQRKLPVRTRELPITDFKQHLKCFRSETVCVYFAFARRTHQT